MTGIIIDRRKIGKDRNLPNRQRFMERARKYIRESAKKQLANRGLTDQSDAEVSIPSRGIGEPRFSHDNGAGEHDYVLPGNETYGVGDRINKPQGGGGGGGGQDGSTDGGGEDTFSFVMSSEEFWEIILEDCELPDLSKRTKATITNMVPRRAGYTTTGSPTNLDIERTMKNGLARRIALKTPKIMAIAELEEELEKTDDDARRLEIEAEIAELRDRAAAIGFLDDVDLRYRAYALTPNPTTQAVMFCLMDVSGSMREREKTIAKKFFVILNRFLKKKYKHVDIVFVRHHHSAEVCDEEKFFYDQETGGTIVSTAYVEARKVINARYSPKEWNIYFAQASDGDNADGDSPLVQQELSTLLPLMQYMAYIEIDRDYTNDYYYAKSESVLWKTLSGIASENPVLNCAKIKDDSEVIKVFRDLFSKETPSRKK